MANGVDPDETATLFAQVSVLVCQVAKVRFSDSHRSQYSAELL